ncbi:MAG: LA_3751/LA_3752 family putative glycosyltransferase [Xenococcaceae cyanobacterium]
MKLSKYPLSLSIILVGILFSLYLQWQIPDGVYFSGDAGLKALLAQQLSSGIFRFDLLPPAQEWVRQLWDNGLYPYDHPFVYQVNSKYFITFPFTFPLVTAPFHALFGYKGLYLIPLISTWVIWLTFYFVCRSFQFKDVITSFALIALIFASPLTIYSAMYWEHTLAVALCFSGIAILLINRTQEYVSWWKVLLAGCLIGLSVWFRPEFLCAIAILIILVYGFFLIHKIFSQKYVEKYNLNLYRSILFTTNREMLVGSAIATVSLFFLCNKLIYTHPLGIHAIQVVEKLSYSQKLVDAWSNFRGLSIAIFQFIPITYLAIWYLSIACIYQLIIFNKKANDRDNLLKINWYLITIYLVCFVFTIGVSLIVPIGTAGLIAGGKQWGPRFLLILIPIITLLVTKIFDRIFQKQLIAPLNFVLISFISIYLLLGITKNTFEATAYLNNNERKLLPAVQFLKEDKHDVLVVSHQLAAQALEAAFERQKIFFKAEDSQKLIQLSKTLVEQNQSEFIYICYPHSPCKLPEEKLEKFKFSQGDRSFKIQLTSLGTFGKYPIYRGAIEKT